MLLVIFIVFSLVLSTSNLTVGRGLGSDLDLSKKILFFILLVFNLLLLDSLINCELCLFKGKDVGMLLTSHALLEVKLYLRCTHTLLKDRVW